jgi:hypothetical protein
MIDNEQNDGAEPEVTSEVIPDVNIEIQPDAPAETEFEADTKEAAKDTREAAREAAKDAREAAKDTREAAREAAKDAREAAKATKPRGRPRTVVEDGDISELPAPGMKAVSEKTQREQERGRKLLAGKRAR